MEYKIYITRHMRRLRSSAVQTAILDEMKPKKKMLQDARGRLQSEVDKCQARCTLVET